MSKFLQSQRITLAHRLKVAWARDENFYFALSQTRWVKVAARPPPPARISHKFAVKGWEAVPVKLEHLGGG